MNDGSKLPEGFITLVDYYSMVRSNCTIIHFHITFSGVCVNSVLLFTHLKCAYLRFFAILIDIDVIYFYNLHSSVSFFNNVYHYMVQWEFENLEL